MIKGCSMNVTAVVFREIPKEEENILTQAKLKQSRQRLRRSKDLLKEI